MKTLDIDIENCYGIKKLKTALDFSKNKAIAIYAPNGAMKSSLAQTFNDIVENIPSKDRIFPARKTKRIITDDTGKEISKDNIVVIRPYDEVFGHTTKTSTLLVDSKLREEYEKLHVSIDNAKNIFIKGMKEVSGSKKDLEKDISLTFTKSDEEFYIAILRVKEEMIAQKDAPFGSVSYDIIFDDKVLGFLNTKDFKTAIKEYIEKYNELLSASTYFKKGVFNYYNAGIIAKSLSDNGFFEAKHTVSLNAEDKTEITTLKELEELIDKEKSGITNNDELKKKFSEIEKQINKNVNLRDFHAYLLENEDLLPELSNIDKFKEKIWKSYFFIKIDLYNELINEYLNAEKRKKEIEEEAGKQRTQWETVIQIFNNRFFVPFTLEAKNRTAVILGQEPLLSLGFTFKDGNESASIEKNELLKSLSTGEKKALYVLNIIFEVEARKKVKQETIFIVDDIADSFDYKNKYAIVEYLKDITEEDYFNQVILTHNFDFFRTVHSRFPISYNNCLMAFKTGTGLSLEKATGIKNVFVNDWKVNYFKDNKKKIASIPFIRNIIEYTKGSADADYNKLTSLLHWKADSATITVKDLDDIYNATFNTKDSSNNHADNVFDVVEQCAKECINAGDGINFENKVVLAIAIRVLSEQFMIAKINDVQFVQDIDSNQTINLFKKYKTLQTASANDINILQRVVLMTPESLHLNSFMYEPILDMSDEHLRKLYTEVQALA